MKFYFNINNIQIGYIDYHYMNKRCVYIDYLSIYERYRGHLYSKQMFNQFKKYVKVHEIRLEAKEDMSRYNKLFNVYKSWGFKPTNIMNFYSNNDTTFRKQLFIFKNQPKSNNKLDTKSHCSI